MNAVGVTRYQRMPVREILAFVEQPVGAGVWQEVDLIEIVHAQYQTVRYQGAAF